MVLAMTSIFIPSGYKINFWSNEKKRKNTLWITDM